MKLRNYCEFINTECDETESSVLGVKAIKLDGKDSLKEALGLINAKSADYFRGRGGKAWLVECSNLRRQLRNESECYRLIQESIAGNSNRQVRRTVDRLAPETRIREEMRYKCIHSLLILHRLGDRCGFRVDEKFYKGIVFIIAICADSPSDVMAFQYLDAQLGPTLKGIVSDVKVIPSGQLAHGFQ